MSNNSGCFKHYIMSFSFKERRTRELLKYRHRVHELENMETDEINFEYITLKSEYEQKKSIFAIFIISIAVALLMNIWKYFFIFIEKASQYASSFKGGEIEIEKVSFAISIIPAVFITILIIAFLSAYMKKIYRIKKELMIVEGVYCENAKRHR